VTATIVANQIDSYKPDDAAVCRRAFLVGLRAERERKKAFIRQVLRKTHKAHTRATEQSK
jgi:hypothetical protein